MSSDEARRAYVERHPERVKASKQRWADDNRERLRAIGARRYRERTAALNIIKSESGCVDCGTRTGRLDFDHRDDEIKLFNVSSNWNRRWDVILAEIAKCDVRCVSCHSRRTNTKSD